MGFVDISKIIYLPGIVLNQNLSSSQQHAIKFVRMQYNS